MNRYLISTNPLNGDEVGRVKTTPKNEISEFVQGAKRAQLSWAELSIDERKSKVIDAFKNLESLQDDLSALISLEMGKDSRRAHYEVAGVIQGAHYICNEVARSILPVRRDRNTEIRYQPLGVVAVISPWNYPLAMANNLIIPALVAGNTLILKPSEHTPLVAEQYVQTLKSALPKGVIDIVHGDQEVGKILVNSDINMVAFTGSVKAGKSIMESSASRLHRLVMELGGNDPMLVLEDADVNVAARFAVASSFENAGQMCTSTERIYVHEKLYEQFVARVVDIAAQYRVGPWDMPKVNYGPMANKEQHQHVVRHLIDAQEKGAKFLLGSPLQEAPFINPTVITGITPDMQLETEETFGPVVAIASVSSTDEAVSRANNSNYGLGAVVFGGGEAHKVAEKLEAGMVGINSPVGSGNAPWVGAKQSGIGFHGSSEGHRNFTQLQVLNS